MGALIINYGYIHKKKEMEICINKFCNYYWRFVSFCNKYASKGTENRRTKKNRTLSSGSNKQLVSLTGEGDYSLAIKVISENDNIPVILVDDCDTILESRNFQIYTKVDSFLLKLGFISPKKITPQFLRNELHKIKDDGEPPIEVNIIGDKQWIYYKDSALLNRLRFYPIYQLGFIGIFMFIAYFIFNSSERSEQNPKFGPEWLKKPLINLGPQYHLLLAWIELLKKKEEMKDMVLEMEKDILRLETTNR